MDSVHKNFYLAPDIKMIKPKKVANDQKMCALHFKQDILQIMETVIPALHSIQQFRF